MAMHPQHDDVLISKHAATTEYEIQLVPEQRQVVCGNRDEAVAKARELARTRKVDAWLTVDHIHFLPLAAHRRGDAKEARP